MEIPPDILQTVKIPFDRYIIVYRKFPKKETPSQAMLAKELLERMKIVSAIVTAFRRTSAVPAS
jgi:hypothetical protein